MRRGLLRLLGCLMVVAIGVGTAVGGAALLLSAIVGNLGWPITAALALALAASAGGALWAWARQLSGAFARARAEAPYLPYRARMREIDALLSDVGRAIVDAAGDETSVDLQGKLLELRNRRDRVLEGILELDRFLEAPGNDETRLAIDGTRFKVRARFARRDLKGTFEENSRRLDRIGEVVRRAKEEREALVAGLESIAIGLKEIRARLAAPGASTNELGKAIAGEISALSQELDRLDVARKEIADFERQAARESTVVAGKASEVPPTSRPS